MPLRLDQKIARYLRWGSPLGHLEWNRAGPNRIDPCQSAVGPQCSSVDGTQETGKHRSWHWDPNFDRPTSNQALHCTNPNRMRFYVSPAQPKQTHFLDACLDFGQ